LVLDHDKKHAAFITLQSQMIPLLSWPVVKILKEVRLLIKYVITILVVNNDDQQSIFTTNPLSSCSDIMWGLD